MAAEVTVRTKGLSKVIANLTKMGEIINSDAHMGLTKALEDFRDASINYLTGLKVGPSLTHMPIRHKSSWMTAPQSITKVRLTLLSEHGAAVEFGTLNSSKLTGGVFRASELTQNKRAFAVGASQGGAVVLSATIKPQRPKSFIRNNLTNPRVHNSMVSRMAEQIRRSIRKVTI